MIYHSQPSRSVECSARVRASHKRCILDSRFSALGSRLSRVVAQLWQRHSMFFASDHYSQPMQIDTNSLDYLRVNWRKPRPCELATLVNELILALPLSVAASKNRTKRAMTRRHSRKVETNRRKSKVRVSKTATTHRWRCAEAANIYFLSFSRSYSCSCNQTTHRRLAVGILLARTKERSLADVLRRVMISRAAQVPQGEEKRVALYTFGIWILH